MTQLLMCTLISSISTSVTIINKHLSAFGENKVGTNFIAVALTDWERRNYLSPVRVII